MLSPYSDSVFQIYKRFLRATHSRNRTPLRIPDYRPTYSGLFVPLIGSISRLQAVRNTSYGCTLYFPLVAQGIDLVRELRHILVGHDTLALRNQCQ